METLAWNPEHEQARYRVLFLTLGSSLCPCLGLALVPCSLLSPALTKLPRFCSIGWFPTLVQIRHGMPDMQKLSGCRPQPAAERRCQYQLSKRDEHFTWAFLPSLLLQSLLNGRRQGPSAQTYPPISLKLISYTVLGCSL